LSLAAVASPPLQRPRFSTETDSSLEGMDSNVLFHAR